MFIATCVTVEHVQSMFWLSTLKVRVKANSPTTDSVSVNTVAGITDLRALSINENTQIVTLHKLSV